MRTLIVAMIAAGSLVLAACGDRKLEQCEHARDVFVTHYQREFADGMEIIHTDDHPKLIELGERQVTRIRELFVSTCLESSSATLACVARIDELEAIEIELSRASKACSHDYKCSKAARAKADEQLGACKQSLTALHVAVELPEIAAHR